MATNTQLKFYKVQTIPETLVVGAIYFEVSTQRICVAKSTTTYDAFGVGLKAATLADGFLTITRYDDTKVTVDFNDIASATSVSAALNAINDKINIINGDGEGSIKKAVADEKERAEGEEAAIRAGFAAADTQIRTDFAAEDTAIRGELAAAKTELEGKIDEKADQATTYTKTEVDTLVNAKANAADVYTKSETDDAIKVVSDALAQEVTDRGTAVQGLQGEVDDIEAKVNTLVGSDADKTVRAIAAEEVAAQLIPENAGEALDTLQEIAAWIQAHPGDASAMNADIETLKTKVGEKAVSVQISEAISALSLDETYVKISDYNTDKEAFEQKDADLQGEIDAAEAVIAENAADIKNLQAGTGLGTASKPTYTNANYIASSTTMVAADMALDAAIKAVDDRLATEVAKVVVTSVTGDADVNANPTTGDVALSLNKATAVAEGDTKVVTAGAVYDALCWVEFA